MEEDIDINAAFFQNPGKVDKSLATINQLAEAR